MARTEPLSLRSIIWVTGMNLDEWETCAMDKDRIKGSFEQAKGTVKEAVGKVTGDSKLETEGKADQAAGKIRNAVGGAKDAVRDAARDK